MTKGKNKKRKGKTDNPKKQQTRGKQPCRNAKRRKQMESKNPKVDGNNEQLPAISLDRFTFHHLLGEGNYGKVMLTSDNVTKQSVAVKILKKQMLLDDDMDKTLLERRVLEVATGCHFLTNLYASFQTENRVFFVMEYVNGGNLEQFMNRHGKLDRDAVRFIAAELVCGLQYLHRHGIIHRDIKPENILLDRSGHLKIADFGLSIENVFDYTDSFGAGTQGYMAPEVLRLERYDAGADWWSFGVILYKMITGYNVFQCGHADEDTPADVSLEERDILERLLCKIPSDRLGKNGNIRDHPFFQSIDWKELEARRTTPPSILRTTSSESLEESGSMDLKLSSKDSSEESLDSEDQRLFDGFSYINPKWINFAKSSAAHSTEPSTVEGSSAGPAPSPLQLEATTAGSSAVRAQKRKRESQSESEFTPKKKKESELAESTPGPCQEISGIGTTSEIATQKETTIPSMSPAVRGKKRKRKQKEDHSESELTPKKKREDEQDDPTPGPSQETSGVGTTSNSATQKETTIPSMSPAVRGKKRKRKQKEDQSESELTPKKKREDEQDDPTPGPSQETSGVGTTSNSATQKEKIIPDAVRANKRKRTQKEDQSESEFTQKKIRKI
ncbi:protein kinase C delta type-like [Pelobates fuscus]|uniref:protein kinase C delta type-like n=1 Tax=Pelobates fuscus TaxID=191477 RepID=UPI002FE44512